MAQTYSTEVSGQYDSPAAMSNGGVVGGRVRRFRATITLASQASGDTIVLANVPAGHTLAYGVLNSTVSLGTAKIKIGTSADDDKYRANATHTATVPTMFGPNAAVSGAASTAAEEVIAEIGTAGLPASGTLVIDLYFSAP